VSILYCVGCDCTVPSTRTVYHTLLVMVVAWQTLDQEKLYTDEELEAFEKQYEEIRRQHEQVSDLVYLCCVPHNSVLCPHVSML